MAWSNDYFECCELGMVSQNNTTIAVIGRAPATPSVYVCTVGKPSRYEIGHVDRLIFLFFM